ncbi:MAG: glycosyltransferase family 2 protein [Bacteroidales bacterium]|nr:glycosyltransferase family 2 protein [Bacteroidales bacterium]
MKTVSIVIPCRDEAHYIGACLDSLIATTYPKEALSVYVCDGMSQDMTRNIVKEYEKKHPFIHLLNNPQRTTPYALNIGIRADNSDVAIILGAHSTVAPDFIERNCEALFSDDSIGCAGGTLTNIYENEISQIIGYAMSQPFGVGNAHFRTGTKTGFVDTVAFGSYKREVFDKVGYFDEQLTRNQDDEFNFRLKKAGYQILLDPSIRSNYVVRASFSKLFRQYFQYGYWKVFVNQKHKIITSIRQLVPCLFVLFLVTACITPILPVFGFFYAAILFLYLIIALMYAIQSSLSPSRWASIILAFIILHVSYGSGYWAGIWDFLICRKKPNYDKSSR